MGRVRKVSSLTKPNVSHCIIMFMLKLSYEISCLGEGGWGAGGHFHIQLDVSFISENFLTRLKITCNK